MLHGVGEGVGISPHSPSLRHPSTPKPARRGPGVTSLWLGRDDKIRTAFTFPGHKGRGFYIHPRFLRRAWRGLRGALPTPKQFGFRTGGVLIWPPCSRGNAAAARDIEWVIFPKRTGGR